MTEEITTPAIPEEAKPEEKPAEPAAGGPDLGQQLPWYRRFSWCLLISLLLAIAELAGITYAIKGDFALKCKGNSMVNA
ncbi:hypothetical protein, partial [Faecalibaculum rodentium]